MCKPSDLPGSYESWKTWKFISVSRPGKAWNVIVLCCCMFIVSQTDTRLQIKPVSSSVSIGFIHCIVLISRAVGGNAEAPFVHNMGEEVRLILLL